MNQDLYFHGIISPSEIIPWSKPSDWLELPELNSGDQVFHGLYAIYEHGHNLVALLCQGNYTVDWGDGTVDNVASNVQAQHAYDYSSIDVDTLSSRGYKQVVITITPQDGQNLTIINLQKQHSSKTSTYGSVINWLDIKINAPYATLIRIGATAAIAGFTNLAVLPLLENCWIGECALTSTTAMFYYCTGLKKVNTFNTASVLTANQMFATCISLQEIPDYDFSVCTTLDSFAHTCSSLVKVNQLTTTSSLTNVTLAFAHCSQLKTVKVFNTGSVTNFSYLFYNAFSMESIPSLNTVSGTDFTFFCNSAIKLISFPSISFNSAITLSSAFSNCYSLTSVPDLTLPACTNMNNLFNGCIKITTIGIVVAPLATALTRAFANCTVSNISDVRATAATAAFTETFTWSLVSANISKLLMTGVVQTFSVAQQPLDRQALIDLFTSLGTVSSKTVTVTGCLGTSSLTAPDLAIATSKGWTVAT